MLPKPHRIKVSQDYQKIYKQGKKIYAPYFLVYLKRPVKQDKDLSLPRFGFVASKKVGNAVSRNKAKRILRGIIRPILTDLKKDFEMVIIAFPKLLETDTNTLTTKMLELLAKEGLYK